MISRLIGDQRNKYLEDIKTLQKDGFIKEEPNRIVLEINLKRLCDTYGPGKAEYFSKVLNIFLSIMDKEHGYKITQQVGFLSVTTILEKEHRDGWADRVQKLSIL